MFNAGLSGTAIQNLEHRRWRCWDGAGLKRQGTDGTACKPLGSSLPGTSLELPSWLGRSLLASPARRPGAAGYWLHTLGGTPLLCLRRQVDAGMVREIWNGIVPQLQQEGLLPEAGVELALTLVFDR